TAYRAAIFHSARVPKPRRASPRGAARKPKGSAFFPRPARVGDPLAPRPRIEPRPGEAGNFHCERVVRGGDARTAVVHDVARRTAAEDREEVFLQFVGLLEDPGG